jgi:thioredoxin-dependent peroxiredoxin
MYNMEYRIQAGEMAPDFNIKSSSGREVRLYDCKNKKTVLMFFFNHDRPGCLERLKALAGDYGCFKEAGIIVFPITILKRDEGEALARELGLPFSILCDEDHSVVRAYNMGQCSDTPSHVCFEVVHDVEFPTMLIVDTSGIIRYRHAVDAAGGGPDNGQLLEECRESLK